MSQDALGQLKHLKMARARWPFPDGLVALVRDEELVLEFCTGHPGPYNTNCLM